ncbi:MAG: ABC transporter substrate-binding protein [bacterium]
MRRAYLVILLLVLLAAIGIMIRTGSHHTAPGTRECQKDGEWIDAEAKAHPAMNYSRVISLAPSITEVLFALELGDRVKGVTTFCDFPPEAQTKEKVGGYYDTSYEAILSLQPDLVIVLTEHEKQRKSLTEMGIPLLVVDQRDTRGILDSILTIGRMFGIEEKACALVSAITTKMGRIGKRIRGLPRPRVMVCIGRTIGTGMLEDVFICGRKGFYHEMLTLAGGVNVYDGPSLQYPSVTGEGITRMNPEVIIEIIPDLVDQGWNEEKVKSEWHQLKGIDAVKNKRIYILGDDHVATPGPRFILTLEQMARVLHPTVDWDE